MQKNLNQKGNLSLFSKLAFWRHEEPLIPKEPYFGMPEEKGLGEFGSDYGAGFGGEQLSPLPPLYPTQQQPRQFQQQPAILPTNIQPRIVEQQQPYNQGISRDQLEVISSKLDALRATLESINQRLINIERIAEGEQDTRRRINW